MVLKIVVGFLSGSLLILSSALDSVMDIITSLINYFAIKKADSSPTKEYSYGYGKLEAIVSLFQGVFILGIAVSIAFFAVEKIRDGAVIEAFGLALGVMIISTVTTFILVYSMKRVARKTRSLILEAECLHYETDIYSNIGILVSLVVIYFSGWHIIDPVLSILVALYITGSALILLKKSFQMLLDKAVSDEVRADIEAMIQEHTDKEVKGFHMLRTRQSGSKILIDFHLVFHRKISLMKAHKIADHIEKHILKKYLESDVLIHLDPYNDGECEERRRIG